jgi:hypothetical protein
VHRCDLQHDPLHRSAAPMRTAPLRSVPAMRTDLLHVPQCTAPIRCADAHRSAALMRTDPLR